jgi:hypothetical protein
LQYPARAAEYGVRNSLFADAPDRLYLRPLELSPHLRLLAWRRILLRIADPQIDEVIRQRLNPAAV